MQCVKRWYEWVFDCFWLFFLCCFRAEGWSGKFNFLWFIEEVVGGGSMGEKREEGFVFSFVFFFILPSSDSLLRYFVTQYASAQIFAHFFLFLILKGAKLKFKK